MKKRIPNSKRNRNKSNFWVIYGFVCAIIVTAITVSLFVFYDYVRNYEIYVPENERDNFTSSLTNNETLTQLANEALKELNLVYEKPETYVDVLVKAFNKDKIESYRDYALSIEGEKEIYDIYCDGIKYMRITLTPEATVKYNVTKWKVSSAELYIDGIIKGGKDYVIYAPHGSSMKVNGFTPIASETGITSPLANELEENNLGTYDVYHLGTLYSAPELECDYDGGNYSILHKDNGIHLFDSQFAPKNFTITAPAEAEVYVNGTLLKDSYVTSENFNCYAPIEKITDSTPKFTVYSTGELFSSPEVTAKLGETELIGKINDDTCTFKYPDDMQYTLSISVPKGADVTVGGVNLKNYYAPEEVKVFGDLATVADESPVMDLYYIESLFSSEFEVKATLDTKELNIIREQSGNDVIYNADHSTMISPDIAEFALDYTKTYFHYTSSGYRNVDANLNAVLAYIESGSDFYKKVKDSKIGYEFVTPVSNETYKTLEVSQVYELTDGTFVAKVKFDVEQTISYVKRNYSGELIIHVTDGSLKVRDMVINSNLTEE